MYFQRSSRKRLISDYNGFSSNCVHGQRQGSSQSLPFPPSAQLRHCSIHVANWNQPGSAVASSRHDDRDGDRLTFFGNDRVDHQARLVTQVTLVSNRNFISHQICHAPARRIGKNLVPVKVFLYSRIKVMRKRPEKGWDGQECECEILGFSNAEVACEHCGTNLGVNRALRREK